MIYFVRLASGSIKIGCSTNVSHRLKTLEKHYGSSVTLLKTIDGDRQTERELHARFAHLRFFGYEQFQPGNDLTQFIGVDPVSEAVQLQPSLERKGPRQLSYHQITLDPETLQYARSLMVSNPDLTSLSAVIRHAARCHQAHAPRTGAPQ